MLALLGREGVMLSKNDEGEPALLRRSQAKPVTVAELGAQDHAMPASESE